MSADVVLMRSHLIFNQTEDVKGRATVIILET